MIPETSTKLLRNVRHNGLGKAFTLDVPAGYGSQRIEATSWNINRVRSHSYSPVRAQENSPGERSATLGSSSQPICSPSPSHQRGKGPG